jgi:hypothetical protein
MSSLKFTLLVLFSRSLASQSLRFIHKNPSLDEVGTPATAAQKRETKYFY